MKVRPRVILVFMLVLACVSACCVWGEERTSLASHGTRTSPAAAAKGPSVTTQPVTTQPSFLCGLTTQLHPLGALLRAGDGRNAPAVVRGHQGVHPLWPGEAASARACAHVVLLVRCHAYQAAQPGDTLADMPLLHASRHPQPFRHIHTLIIPHPPANPPKPPQAKPFPVNCMSLMTVSGAKGSLVNFSQIAVLLGQQELEGRWVRWKEGLCLPKGRSPDQASSRGLGRGRACFLMCWFGPPSWRCAC